MPDVTPLRPEIETSPSEAGQAAERYEALAPGVPMVLAPGIMALRLPIPFALDHVNCYVLEDGDGWFVVDTGVNAESCRAAWEAALAGPLAGRPITRILVTHFHLDHIGLAGWLAARSGAEIIMSQREHEAALASLASYGPNRAERQRVLYRRGGFSPEEAAMLIAKDSDFRPMVTPLPAHVRYVAAGDVLTIGGREFGVMTGGGHAPDQVMLHAREDDLFLAADQVLARISPHISVHPDRIRADPLGAYLRSLAEIAERLADSTLILAGHGVPFRGVRGRIAELNALHEKRCRAVLAAAAERPQTVRELMTLLYARAKDPFGLVLALSETLAHTNRVIVRGELSVDESGDGAVTFSTTAQGRALLAA